MARTKHGTLTANTVATITVSGVFDSALLVNRGDADIFYTNHADADGAATPTVGGDDTGVVPAGLAAEIPAQADRVTVKLISSGTPAYSLVGGGTL